MTEAVLQRLILARLGALPGVWVWRQNTGAAHTPEGFVRFGLPGQPDISGILRGGRALFVEVKSEHGRLRKDQENFIARATELGALCVVARTLEDALRPVCEALGMVPP